MNTQIHSPHSFYFNTLILILLVLLQGFSLSAVAELLIEPTTPAVTVGQSITLSVSGASGEVIWTPTKGNIQGMGTSVTYVAPTQPGADAVMVLDGAGNVEVIKIEVSSANSFTLENAVWRVFTNRSWIRAILLSEDRKTLWIGTTGGLEQRDAITDKLERVYTALDGLPNNNVGALVSDGNGGLWVGTVGGLAHRNNNEEWTVFKTDNSKLPDNSVNTLMSDGKGGLWIGTEGGGLAFLSDNQEWHIFNTDNSQLPNNKIQTIVSDGNGGLWLGTSGGLAHLNSHGEWKSFNAEHSELPNNQVNVLLNAGNDGLWIGTAGGLVHLSRDEKWQVFKTDNSGLPDNNVDAILNNGNRGLWVGTGKLGNKTGGLAHLNKSQEWTVYHVENSELPNNTIRTLASDGNDRLWIGTWGSGLVRLKEQEWRRLDNAYLPGGNAVLTLMSESDETDDLWIGTSFGGLAHLNNRNQLTTFDLSPLSFSNEHISALFSDSSDRVWIGAGRGGMGGLAYISNEKEWTDFNLNLRVNTFLDDNKGGLWIGTDEGLFHLNSHAELIESISTDNSELPHNSIQSLLNNEKGELWIGTGNGLAHRTDKGEWTVFGASDAHNVVNALVSDGKAGMWIGTNLGLFHLNGDGEFENFNTKNSSLPSNYINALVRDKNNGLWLGTGEDYQKGGLVHLSEDEEWMLFNTANSGLPSNDVISLLNDDSGGLLVGTLNGGLTHLTFTQKTSICEEATDDEAKCQELLKGRRAAILIHPNGQGNGYNQKLAVDFMATYAYQSLQSRGYDNDEIYFLSYKPDLDINADGQADINAVDAPVTLLDFRRGTNPRDINIADVRAAFEWAKEKGELDYPLIVTFVDHGEPNELLLDPVGNQTLTGDEFRRILDDYQNATNNQVVVILEACHSGTLVTKLAGTDRVIISSTDEKLAYYNDLGNTSFIKLYFDHLRQGENFWQALQAVKEEVSGYLPPLNQQRPQLNDSVDGALAQGLCLNGCFGALPGVLTLSITSLPSIVAVEEGVEIKISITIPFGQVQEVTASLLTPTLKFNKFGYPLQPHPIISFKPVNTRPRASKKQWQGQVLGSELTTHGRYTLTIKVRDNNGFTTDETLNFCVESCEENRLTNISTRAAILGGTNDVIAGFIITGTGTQKVIIRGLSLEAGVDPKLTVHQYPSGELLASNHNWQTDPRVAEIPAHLVLPNPIDAGVLLDLPVGAYTAILSSGGVKGLGLISVDEVESNSTTKLTNISTRASIQGGANDVIAGFIITGTGSQKVMIRGLALEAGLDPKLTLQKYPSGEPVASNDNWQTDSRASEIPEHMKLQSPTDAGLLLDLPVGAYTAILSSVGAKGLGLIGVDALD